MVGGGGGFLLSCAPHTLVRPPLPPNKPAAPEVPLYPRHLHGLDHHARQAEGHLLGELVPLGGGRGVGALGLEGFWRALRLRVGELGVRGAGEGLGFAKKQDPPHPPAPVHGRLEAVPEVDVQQLPAVAVQHQVAGVAVAQAFGVGGWGLGFRVEGWAQVGEGQPGVWARAAGGIAWRGPFGLQAATCDNKAKPHQPSQPRSQTKTNQPNQPTNQPTNRPTNPSPPAQTGPNHPKTAPTTPVARAPRR